MLTRWMDEVGEIRNSFTSTTRKKMVKQNFLFWWENCYFFKDLGHIHPVLVAWLFIHVNEYHSRSWALWVTVEAQLTEIAQMEEEQ